ncbi:MAG: hypothetical protein ACRDUA_05235 [Micromonosporaceae bacterium]
MRGAAGDRHRAAARRRSAVTVADTAMAARLVVAAVESLVHRFLPARGPGRPGPGEIERFENELVAMLLRYLTPGAP